jgi:hypothetical protein
VKVILLLQVTNNGFHIFDSNQKYVLWAKFEKRGQKIKPQTSAKYCSVFGALLNCWS